jgi:hypothetical protein
MTGFRSALARFRPDTPQETGHECRHDAAHVMARWRQLRPRCTLAEPTCAEDQPDDPARRCRQPPPLAALAGKGISGPGRRAASRGRVLQDALLSHAAASPLAAMPGFAHGTFLHLAFTSPGPRLHAGRLSWVHPQAGGQGGRNTVWPLFPPGALVLARLGLSGTSKTTRSSGLPALGDHYFPARPMIAAQIRRQPQGSRCGSSRMRKRAAQILGHARRRDRR